MTFLQFSYQARSLVLSCRGDGGGSPGTMYLSTFLGDTWPSHVGSTSCSSAAASSIVQPIERVRISPKSMYERAFLPVRKDRSSLKRKFPDDGHCCVKAVSAKVGVELVRKIARYRQIAAHFGHSPDCEEVQWLI